MPPGTTTPSWFSRRNGEEARNVVSAQTPDPNHPVKGKPIAFMVVRRTFSRIQGNYVGSGQGSGKLVRLPDILEMRGEEVDG
jgi:hypothetical protein